MAKTVMNKARSSSVTQQESLTEAIRNKAQELFEKNGRKPGRDLENWLEAERIIKSRGK